MNTPNLKTSFSIWGISVSLVIPAMIFFLVFSACTDQTHRRQQSLDDMKSYVKVHKDSIDNYTDVSWDKLDQEFSQKKAALDNDVDKMNAEMKESYNSTLRQWDSVKSDYNDRQAEKTKLAHIEKVRSKLYIKAPAAAVAAPDAVRKPDFSDIGPGEIQSQYQNFVDVVRQYKEDYSSEDWTMVNKTWKDLNKRRRQIKDSISVGDAKKIMKLQLDYTAIKAVNRPIAESDEDL